MSSTETPPRAHRSEKTKVGRGALIRRLRIDPLLVAVLALLALFLTPTLRNGYRADDTWSSEVQGTLDLTGRSLPEYLWDVSAGFWRSGRPNLLGTVQGFSFSWALNDHPVAYHTVLVLLVVVAAWALYALVREFGVPRSVALMAVVVVAGTIQLRSFHDAVLGYWGTIQIVLTLTLSSLLFFLRGLRSGERRHLVWSFLLFLPCPLLYEGAYPLAVLFLAVALSERRGRAAFRASAPFLLLAGVFIALSLYLRTTATALVPGYEVSGNPWAALRTFLIQLFAPIPGSTLMFRGEYANFLPLGTSPTKAELLAGAWRGVAVFAVVLVVVLRLAGRDGVRLPTPGVLGRIAVVGALLWTASVLAVAAAPKYQIELVAGKGHLPTLIQSFGWTLVIVAGLLALARVAASRSALALRLLVVGAAALLGFGAAVNGYNNMRVVALEVPITKARGLLEAAAGDGALASLPPGATLLFSPRDVQWNTGSFSQDPSALQAMLMDRAGHRFDSRPLTVTTRLDCPAADVAPDCLAPVGREAAWVRVRTRRGGGSVIVAPLATSITRSVDRQVARELRVYARGGGGTPPPPRLISSTPSGRPWDSEGLAWRRVADGGGWALYTARVTGAAPVASLLDDAIAQVDFTSPGTPDQIVRIYGTKSLLP